MGRGMRVLGKLEVQGLRFKVYSLALRVQHNYFHVSGKQGACSGLAQMMTVNTMIAALATWKPCLLMAVNLLASSLEKLLPSPSNSRSPTPVITNSPINS